jgi:hypothetical protein
VISPRQSNEARPTPTENSYAGFALSTVDSDTPVSGVTLALTPSTIPEPIEATATQILAPEILNSPADDGLQLATETRRRPDLLDGAVDTAEPSLTITQQFDPTKSNTATIVPSVTPTATSLPTASSTPTKTPNSTPTSKPASPATPLLTATPRPTATSQSPGIRGRILLNEQPVEPGLLIQLEDRSFNQITETVVGPEGLYQFLEVPASEDGYHITFSWERNQWLDPMEVVAWGWIGPVVYDGQGAVVLPDLEIALLGLEPVQPEPDSSISSDSISASTPVVFVWGSHPAADRYWIDILAGPSFGRLWRSTLSTATSAEFDGQLDDGTRISSGTHWWAVGGRSTKGGYRLTVYSHLAGFRITS